MNNNRVKSHTGAWRYFLLIMGTLFSSVVASEQSPYPDNVYWGDTHLHTNLSVDAYSLGNRLSPSDAYRFAQGEQVKGFQGVPLKLERPLDFLVVADHAANMGVYPALEAGDPQLMATEVGKQWHTRLQEALPNILKAKEFSYKAGRTLVELQNHSVPITTKAFQKTVWEKVAATADRYNKPGKFTAFIGYEWTPMETYIHRVVVFKDGAEMASQTRPFTQLDSLKPEDLWDHLADYHRKTGGEVLAIPHNANLSPGNMFALTDSQGKSFTVSYAKTRSRWEPLLEVVQQKGDSETHPLLSSSDEFADYEVLEPYKKTREGHHRYEYARSALKLGISEQNRLGVNPFKFGMLGSTDSHTSLSAAENKSYWVTIPVTAGNEMWWRHSVGGYAAIWARENTRESLFDAMRRREVYATTGSRIRLRFFGGWDYDKDDALKSDLANVGYTKGVPMGGDLTRAPVNKAPSFLVRAIKDPDGANLDRVQVIKGWLGKDGELYEKVYNVALSDNRVEDKNGKAPPVGNTVNVEGASYTNTIGDPELTRVWTDPDFKRNELAFYYVRVLEIPTPRWPAYAIKNRGLAVPGEVPLVAQQRAYTSPIWYTPSLSEVQKD